MPNIDKLLKTDLLPYDAINEAQYADSCSNSKYMSILIQHIENAKTLQDYLLDTHDTSFIKDELIYVIYQIYYTLSSIAYTHYDLHTNNVILYLPDPTKYIQYHYHTPSGIVSFKSRFMVKIIDYGRNYIVGASRIAQNAVCSISECQPKCGSEYGYKLDYSKISDSFITPWKGNISHDLRLITIVIKILKMRALNNLCTSSIILTRILDIVYHGNYGTPENITNSYYGLPAPNIANKFTIHNVKELNATLNLFMVNNLFSKDDNDNYASAYTKMGELNVHPTENMTYSTSTF